LAQRLLIKVEILTNIMNLVELLTSLTVSVIGVYCSLWICEFYEKDSKVGIAVTSGFTIMLIYLIMVLVIPKFFSKKYTVIP